MIEFVFEGRVGTVDNGYVCWGGMGFQLEAAVGGLRQAIENAIEPKAEPEPTYCPACSLEQTEESVIGRLGDLEHRRCRFCGWQWAERKL